MGKQNYKSFLKSKNFSDIKTKKYYFYYRLTSFRLINCVVLFSCLKNTLYTYPKSRGKWINLVQFSKFLILVRTSRQAQPYLPHSSFLANPKTTIFFLNENFEKFLIIIEKQRTSYRRSLLEICCFYYSVFYNFFPILK